MIIAVASGFFTSSRFNDFWLMMDSGVAARIPESKQQARVPRVVLNPCPGEALRHTG